MFGSRRNRPSLIARTAQTAARTAVIAGTATAVSGAVAGRQTGGAPQPAAPSAAAPAAGLTNEAIEQLQKLADLHKAGILNDDEFAAQKARILG
ncbi:MAG: SHOCT domain-containing protein [Amaricoccus sp.]